MPLSPEVRTALDTLAAVAATPFSQADTIPPLLYRSDEVHALELDRIFAKEWLCCVVSCGNVRLAP